MRPPDRCPKQCLSICPSIETSTAPSIAASSPPGNASSNAPSNARTYVLTDNYSPCSVMVKLRNARARVATNSHIRGEKRTEAGASRSLEAACDA